ncbi:MAG: hypothetical protein RMK32_08660 [Anaerolineae bacterium]|nr:hypothetical protein [Anaerolineae bacterium]
MPLTLQEVARQIREALEDPERGEREAWLPIREFLDEFRAADPHTREAMIADRPDPAGDPRFDAYLAALAEYLALRHGLPVPVWVEESNRFLDRWWFPTSFRSLHAMALVESPASFRRRGIFVDHTEFERC